MNTSKFLIKRLIPSVLFPLIFLVGLSITPVSLFAQTRTTVGVDSGTISKTVGEDEATKNPITTDTDISNQFQLKNPIGSGSTDMAKVLDKILNSIVVLLTPILVLMLIYSGYLFVIGRGNTEKITEAKKTLTYTLIGAVIVVAASGIAHVIENTIGVIIG